MNIKYGECKESDLQISSITDNVNLSSIGTCKFKTEHISMTYAVPLDERSATYNSLLARVLDRGCAKYTSMNVISNKLDGMYGAYVGMGSGKDGENHVLDLNFIFLPKKFIDVDVMDEGLELMYEIMYNPLVKEGGFDNMIFEQEQKNLEDAILALENDKIGYSIEKCIELTCMDSPYRINSLGTLEMLKTITKESLYEYYKEFINRAKIDVMIAGSMDRNEVKTRISKAFSHKFLFTPDKINPINPVSKAYYERVNEYSSINQAKIAIGYKTDTTIASEDYEAMVLAINILGGDADSLLFSNVREKESLCYYIFATQEKFKGIMLIGAGVESKNVDKTLDLIDKNVEMLKMGEFTDEMLENSKLSIITVINSISDSQSSILNYHYGYQLYGLDFNQDNYKNKIMNLTRKDVMAVAGKIQKVKTFVLDSEDGKDGGE